MLIAIGMGFFGVIAQIGGFLLIFRSFLPELYDYICKTPVIGPYLSIILYDGRELLAAEHAGSSGGKPGK